ncbi:MAG: hypothetical protein K9I94_03760 [Bacteroidales bacterium]|nr:hypothetical protein [Bacteroidales bacterium]
MKLLERMYTNIEGYKSLRFKVPVVTSGLILALTGFVLESDKIPQDNSQKIFIIIILFVFTLAGILLVYGIRKQYNYLVDNINHLYKRLDIKGKKFYAEGRDYINNPMRRATYMFLGAYIIIGLIGSICILAIITT